MDYFLVQVSSGWIYAAGDYFNIHICTLMLLMLNFYKTETCFLYSSQTIDRIDLKLSEYASIIVMHLP